MLASTTRHLVPKLISPILRAPATKGVQYLSTSAIRLDSEDPVHKVGPYPRTKEERERAAKKYNLIPEDYEPYDEGDGWGDYPKLKAIGAYNRDWYDDFDDPVDNKFYGEPLHLHYDLYMWEKIDPLEDEKQDTPFHLKLIIFIGIATAVPILVALSKHFRIHINHPWKQRGLYPNQRLFEFPSSGGGHH